MGADSFLSFYGVKIALDQDDEAELDACGDETDARCIKAKQAGLDCYSGRMTDGEDYFLYVGKHLASLGLEHDQYVTHSLDSFATIATSINEKLKNAGFNGIPAFHFQFQGQY